MAELAELFKCHKRTILRMISRGELKTIQVGSRLKRVPESEVERLLNASKG